MKVKELKEALALMNDELDVVTLMIDPNSNTYELITVGISKAHDEEFEDDEKNSYNYCLLTNEFIEFIEDNSPSLN